VVELRKFRRTITARTLVARKKRILIGEEKTLQKKCTEKSVLTESTPL